MLELLIIPSGGFAPAELASLAAEFPTVALHDDTLADARPPIVDAAGWADPAFDARPLDVHVAEAAARGPFGLRTGGRADGAWALLTRYQRFLGRRNRASACPGFDDVLAEHRALHELDRPLCRADHEHALDTWQWLLRLEPEASFALQAAALFHDVERLESEPLQRIEHRAPSYQDFKDAHARRGASITREVLTRLRVDAAVVARASALVEGHERTGVDREGVLLSDADALSFFSLNSSGFLDYYGADHTQRKVAYTLGRLRPESRTRLSRLRLRPEIATFVATIQSSTGG